MTPPTKEPSADSLPDPCLSSLENSPGERTAAALAAYDQDQEKGLKLIGLRSLTPRGLAVAFICWLLLILALVFGSILLTLWATPAKGSGVSSTAVLPLESVSAGLTAKRRFCSPSRLCDGFRSISEINPFD